MFLKKLIKGFGIIAVCATLTIGYAFKIEPYTSIVKSYPLGTRQSGDTLRIVQLSDIQISENYTADNLKKLVKKVNGLKPDVFIFTGDLYENYALYGPEKEVISELASIEAPYGKFAIWGNRDYGGGCKPHYAKILSNAGIELLQNADVTVLTEQNHAVWIGGLDDALLGKPDMGTLTDGLEKEADYRILLTHEPDTADLYGQYDIDLILAGHSHGGQVQLPFWKGIRTSMAEKYTAGFYQMNNDAETLLYVNTGIGTSHYPVRLFVPPEISVFDIGLAESPAVQKRPNDAQFSKGI